MPSAATVYQTLNLITCAATPSPPKTRRYPASATPSPTSSSNNEVCTKLAPGKSQD
jgi:hypothetical protein